MTLALVGGTVVTALDRPEMVEADVVVEEGRVSSVGEAPGGAVRLDCSDCLVIPGIVCAHTHLYSALARGMPYALDPPRNFLQILQRVWWRLDRALDADLVRASALVGAVDAVLAGTTTLVDHHASPEAIDGSLDLIAEALREVGVRGVLCYEVTDRDGPGRAAAGVRENARFLAGSHPLARGMVGAHASFTLSEDTLRACAEVARAAGSGVHVHVAEDLADQGDAVERFGDRVVGRLAKAGLLTDRDLLAHCVHLDAGEAATLRDAGVTVAHNARSNMNNSVGRAPVAALGDRVALGTDGIGGDMFAESQAAYFRAREDDVSAGPEWALARLAEGARFAGRTWGEPGLGRVEAGAPADLVVLRYEAPTPVSPANLAWHWVFGLSRANVRDVVVAGEVVVRDGRPTRVDPSAVAAQARTEANRLWRRLEEIGPHDFQPAGVA